MLPRAAVPPVPSDSPRRCAAAAAYRSARRPSGAGGAILVVQPAALGVTNNCPRPPRRSADRQPTVSDDHDVGGLDVSVDDALLVGGVKGFGGLLDQAELFAEAQARLGTLQRLAIDELHGDVGFVGHLADLVDLADLRRRPSQRRCSR